MMSLLLHPNLDHQQKAIEGMQTCADVCDFAGAVQLLEVRLQEWNHARPYRLVLGITANCSNRAIGYH